MMMMTMMMLLQVAVRGCGVSAVRRGGVLPRDRGGLQPRPRHIRGVHDHTR